MATTLPPLEGLDEQQQQIQRALRAWCDASIWPKLDGLEDGTVSPYALMRALADDFGLRQLVGDGERGGAEGSKAGASGALFGRGADPMLGHLVMMELSRASPGLALSFGASLGLAGGTIMARGTRAQRKRWALPLLRLEQIGAWGLSEPGAGSDAFGSMQTVALRDGDGWKISGTKTFITNAPCADLCVIYARLRDEPGAPVGAFVVEANSPGLTLGPPMDKLGMRESPTGEIALEQVRVSGEHLLGEGAPDDASRSQARQSLNQERSAMPAMAMGMVDRVLSLCVAYAQERVQFGQPIASFQAVQLRLSRMAEARELIWSWLLRLAAAERVGQVSASLASAAKLSCGEQAVMACQEAVQLMGGFGYMREGRVEKFLRDAILLEIGGGAKDIQRLRIAHGLLR